MHSTNIDIENSSRQWCMIASLSLDDAQFKMKKLQTDLILSQYATLYTTVACGSDKKFIFSI